MKKFFVAILCLFLISGCSSKEVSKESIKAEEIYTVDSGTHIFEKKSVSYEYVKALKKNDKVKLSKIEEEEDMAIIDHEMYVYIYSCDDEICKASPKIEDGKMSDDDKFKYESLKFYIPVKEILSSIKGDK